MFQELKSRTLFIVLVTSSHMTVRLEGWDRSDIACIGIPDPNQLDGLKRACIIGGGPILGYRDCRL